MPAGMYLLVSNSGTMQLRRSDRDSSEAPSSNSRAPLADTQPLPSNPRRRFRRPPRIAEAVPRRQQHLRHQTIRIPRFTSSPRALHPTHSSSNSRSIRVRWSPEPQCNPSRPQQDPPSGRLRFRGDQQRADPPAITQPYAEGGDASVCWVEERRTVGTTEWDKVTRTRCVFRIRWSWNVTISIHGFKFVTTIHISRITTYQCIKYPRIRFRNHTSRCFRRFGLRWPTSLVKQQNRCNTRIAIGDRTTCSSCTTTRESHTRCSTTWYITTWRSCCADCTPQSFPLRLPHPRIVGRTISQWECRRIPSTQLLYFSVGVEWSSDGSVGFGKYRTLSGTSDQREFGSVEGDIFGKFTEMSVLCSAAAVTADSATEQMKPPVRLHHVAIASIVFQSVCARYLLMFLRSECIRDTCKTISA